MASTRPNRVADARKRAPLNTTVRCRGDSNVRVIYRSTKSLPKSEVLRLYRSVQWSAAKKPTRLLRAIRQSHSVVSAWIEGSLVGLGNAISDGSLVVYY